MATFEYTARVNPSQRLEGMVEVESAAVKGGMKTLRQDGWRKVRAGITSLSEVLRVSHADELLGLGT